MINILTITGAVVWIIIFILVSFAIPVIVSFIIGWVSYKLNFLTIRDISVGFVQWYLTKIQSLRK